MWYDVKPFHSTWEYEQIEDSASESYQEQDPMRKFWEAGQRIAILAKLEGKTSDFDPDAEMWPTHTTLKLRDL